MKKTALLISGVILTLLAWEWAASRHATTRLFISSPANIGEYVGTHYRDLLEAASRTLTESFFGLVLAATSAIGTMIMCIIFPRLLKMLLPLMVVFQVIPLITIAPLLIIILGSGMTPVVVMSALLAYFPIFVNFANGVRHLDPSIIDFLTLNKASLWDKVRLAYFPLSLPYLFAGLRVGATLAVIGAIVAEFSGIPVGLGRNLYISSLRLEPELMMSTLFLSSILGGLFYSTVVGFERIFAKWYTPGLGV
jgi:NitT/TauT family transport system permease protein